jgi:hypothetical protein
MMSEVRRLPREAIQAPRRDEPAFDHVAVVDRLYGATTPSTRERPVPQGRSGSGRRDPVFNAKAVVDEVSRRRDQGIAPTNREENRPWVFRARSKS